MLSSEPWRAGISYHNPFFIQELSSLGAAVCLNQNSNAFGLTAELQGYDVSHRLSISLSAAQKLSSSLTLGLSTFYQQLVAKPHLHGYSIGIIGSLSYSMTKKAMLHFIGHQSVRNTDVFMGQSVYCLGLTYEVSDKTELITQLDVDVFHGSAFRLGLTYLITEKITLLAGVASNPAVIGFGFRLRLKKLTLSMAQQRHQLLGFSPLICAET